jgi:hypothetical protein
MGSIVSRRESTMVESQHHPVAIIYHGWRRSYDFAFVFHHRQRPHTVTWNSPTQRARRQLQRAPELIRPSGRQPTAAEPVVPAGLESLISTRRASSTVVCRPAKPPCSRGSGMYSGMLLTTCVYAMQSSSISHTLRDTRLLPGWR